MIGLQSVAVLANYEFVFHPSEAESRLGQSLQLHTRPRQIPPLPQHTVHRASRSLRVICLLQ